MLEIISFELDPYPQQRDINPVVSSTHHRIAVSQFEILVRKQCCARQVLLPVCELSGSPCSLGFLLVLGIEGCRIVEVMLGFGEFAVLDKRGTRG